MSEAEVQIVLQGYDALARGDAGPGRAGFDEIARVGGEHGAALEGLRPEVLDVRDLGAGVLLATVRWSATVRATGLEVDQVLAQVCRVSGGRWVEMRSFESADDGLAAAIVLRGLEAFNARDLDALVELCHPEVEVVVRRSALEGAFTGHDGAQRWAREALEWAPDYTFHVDGVRVDGGVVHVTGRERGTGLAGVPIDDPLDARIAIRGGLIVHLRTGGT